MNTKLIFALAQAVQLLPTFVLSIQTMFGKETGESKKDAVKQLVSASIAGASFGFGVAGDEATSQAIAGFAPVSDQLIDSVVANYKAAGHPAFATAAVAAAA